MADDDASLDDDPFQSLADQTFTPNDDPGFFSDVFNGVEDFFFPSFPDTDSNGNVIQGDGIGGVADTVLSDIASPFIAVENALGLGNGPASTDSSGFPIWGYFVLALLILLVGAYITREVAG